MPRILSLLILALFGPVVLSACDRGSETGEQPNRFQPGPSAIIPNEPGSEEGAPETNTFVSGGAVFFIGGQAYKANSSCRGSVCTLRFQGESVTIDIAELEPRLVLPDITADVQRNGVAVARYQVRDSGLLVDSYGAWNEYSVGTPAAAWMSVSGQSVRLAMPLSIGHSIGTNPVSGSATWRGAMVGNAYSGQSLGNPVVGDTTLTADFRARTVDVDITGITERFSQRLHADMLWRDLRMNRGAFRARGIDGRFYGPNHEEAGGVIDNNSIVGAFSAKRR